MSILIVTVADDLHAEAIRHRLRTRFGADCSIVECDRVSHNATINWCRENRGGRCVLGSKHGPVDMSECTAIWWRRARSTQADPSVAANDAYVDLVNNDCRAALFGSLLSMFGGAWISHPMATDRAGNKLVQLRTASELGFRIPATLVTQAPERVGEFLARHPQSIVKPVFGTPKELCYTQYLSREHLKNTDGIRVSPAMYQEFIPGTRHVRLNCFGDRSFAAMIETDKLDWRANLNTKITDWEVPSALHNSIRAVLDALELKMGVVDLKLTPEGEPVWLEVNPQGQFLFLEGLTGRDYTEVFAEFLYSESLQAQCAIRT